MYSFKTIFNNIIFVVFIQCSLYAQNYSNKHLKDSISVLIKKNKKEAALKLSIDALKSADQNKNIELQIYWNTKIGDILKNNHDFKNALDYYKYVKKLSLTTKDSLAIAKSIFNLASLNNYEYSLAVQSLRDINAKANKRTKAFKHFDYLLNNFKNIKGTDTIIAKTYANLTGLYSYTKEDKKVYACAEKAVEYFRKFKDTLSIIGIQNNIGVTQIFNGEYNAAEKIFKETLPLLKDTANLKVLNYKIIYLNNLSQIYTKQEKYKQSLNYLEKSIILENILEQKKHDLSIAEIEEKYSQERKIIIEKEKSELWQLWIGIICLVFVFIIIFAFISCRNKNLKSRNLNLSLIQNDLKNSNEIKKIQNENKNKIIGATLDARIKERKYIAEVLHDSVSSLLSSANMHLQVVDKKCNDNIEEIDKSRDIIKEISEKVRDLSHNLMPVVLLKFGLNEATLDLCEKYTNSEITFKLINKDVIPRFHEDFEIKIYNIIEEITNNIIKHSAAKNAIITLNYSNNSLDISIIDDGNGFDINCTQLQCGIGLSLIKTRVKNFKGTFNIHSKINAGTRIEISIPVS